MSPETPCARPVPVPSPHLGTPARGLPSDAPGTGSRRGPRSRAGTGTAPSPAARVACSAVWLTGLWEGSGAVAGCWRGSPHCRQGAGHAWGGSHRARSLPVSPGSRSGVHSGRSSCPPRWAGRHRRLCRGRKRRHRRCSGRPGFPVGRSCSLRAGGRPHGAQPVPPAQAMPSWHLAPAPQTACLAPNPCTAPTPLIPTPLSPDPDACPLPSPDARHSPKPP